MCVLMLMTMYVHIYVLDRDRGALQQTYYVPTGVTNGVLYTPFATENNVSILDKICYSTLEDI